jgi:hypothetical protein
MDLGPHWGVMVCVHFVRELIGFTWVGVHFARDAPIGRAASQGHPSMVRNTPGQDRTGDLQRVRLMS